MDYGDFKDLPRRTASVKVLQGKDKSAIKSEIIPNQQLLEELCKPIVRNFDKFLGKGRTQVLNDTTLTAEAECCISYSEQGKKSCLSLH